MFRRTSVALLFALGLADGAHAATARREAFGVTKDGQAVEAVVLTNAHGVKARVIAWGATLQELDVPDRTGRLADVVLSYPDMTGFQAYPQYFGATVGRYANRIADAHFSLDGQVYILPVNDGPNSLHGGKHGFDRLVWKIEDVKSGPSASVTLVHVSPDGDQGYPGELTARVTYALDEAGALTLTYAATTTKPTVVNLTNHSLFNLAGAASGRSVLDQRLTILSDAITPVDARLIPTGELQPVAGGPFDFRTSRLIGERIHDGADPQIVIGQGYDHNFVLRGGETAKPRLAVRMQDPVSGRVMEMLTTEPGVQVYSGNFLDGRAIGKGHEAYRQGDGLALEAQHFPDAPNHPTFLSTRLDPGQVYRQVTIYRFSTSAK
jgi:aldose 1-epimerase